ncbi:hypothetical protein [Micromonospora sp. NPDC051296]|uniref:hypothetical protein n=1 Tax=Micromonospora sp. NPDC051296 TaxID=3155046 RepID=UPI0034402C15
MPRWKWFQRKDEPIDVVERSAYPDRAGAYGTGQPAWNAPTAIQPQQRPLMTRAGLWRSSHAVRPRNLGNYR